MPQTIAQSMPVDHVAYATPTMAPNKQKLLEEEIETQAQAIVEESAKLDEAHVKARAFHQMALESGRAMVPAAESDATLELNESPTANVYKSFTPNEDTVQEASKAELETAPEEANSPPRAAAIAERMPVDVDQQPFETPNPRHALARVSTSPRVVHALDAHNVPIAEHHETTADHAVSPDSTSSSTFSDAYATSLKCKKLIEEYDLRRAAAAAHPEVYVHTLGVTNEAARRVLEARVAHGGIQPYSSTTQEALTRDIPEIDACPSIATMTLSEMLDRSMTKPNPIMLEVVHSKHFGGRTATLIRGDGKPLDRDGQVSHMTIEGNARRNNIQAQLYAYEPFFHPQTSGQQYVYSNLSEGGLHQFQTTQCDPSVTLMIDWVLRNIILDPLLPPIDVY